MDAVPKRKAGRPTGSLNKATIRAQAIEEELTPVSADITDPPVELPIKEPVDKPVEVPIKVKAPAKAPTKAAAKAQKPAPKAPPPPAQAT